jgi:hypothetical protein
LGASLQNKNFWVDTVINLKNIPTTRKTLMNENKVNNTNNKINTIFYTVTTIAVLALMTVGGCCGLLGIFMTVEESTYPGAIFYGGEYHWLIAIFFLSFPVNLLVIIILSVILHKMQKTIVGLYLYAIPLLHLVIGIGISI